MRSRTTIFNRFLPFITAMLLILPLIGAFYFVYRPAERAEALLLLRQNGIEPTNIHLTLNPYICKKGRLTYLYSRTDGSGHILNGHVCAGEFWAPLGHDPQFGKLHQKP